MKIHGKHRVKSRLLQGWGPVQPLVAPPLSTDGWSWTNQGGAAVEDQYHWATRALWFNAPAAAGDNLRVRHRALPAAPYTIKAEFAPLMASAAGAGELPLAGLCWREDATGEIYTVAIAANGDNSGKLMFRIDRWTSATVFSANMVSNFADALMVKGGVSLWLADDNTDRRVSYSVDGVNEILLWTEVRTTFLTADQYGLVLNADSATYPVSMTLRSLEVTQP